MPSEERWIQYERQILKDYILLPLVCGFSIRTEMIEILLWIERNVFEEHLRTVSSRMWKKKNPYEYTLVLLITFSEEL